MAVLVEQQYQLGQNGVVFGGIRTTDYYVAKADWGAPEERASDQPLALGDGVRFGRDWKGGRTITFDLNINVHGGTARRALDALAADWLGEDVRQSPGAVLPLRYCLAGETRRVYGRPRNFAFVTGAMKRGWVPVTADFVTVDHLVYDDDESSNLARIAPSGIGGFVAPFTVPWSSAAVGPNTELRCAVGGYAPAWLCFDLYGPVSQPVIEVVDRFTIRLDLTLLADQSVTIDPRPWRRTVRGNFNQNWAGRLTQDSPAMPDMRVPPGVHTVTLRGVDQTGTAALRTRWRAARAAY